MTSAYTTATFLTVIARNTVTKQPRGARQAVNLTLAMALLALSAHAQQYPSKPIRSISPFAAGGGNDLISRIVTQKVAESMKQQVIVETRAGANGIVGTEAAA